jgi:hypothetical protein
MERGKMSLDALFDHAFTWCVANLPVEPVRLGCRFPVGIEKYLTLRNYTLLHNRLQGVCENDRILLANPPY